jgi:lysophospholipase L1-like esterase
MKNTAFGIQNCRRALVWLLVAISFQAIAQTKAYDTLPNVPDHYVKRFAMFKKEQTPTGIIMMVGNSITEGGDWKQLLNDSTIINRGISGDVTFGVLNRLDEIIGRKPSKIFLLIGVNDLSRNTPDEVIVTNIYRIAHTLRTRLPDTQVFVQSILPTNESFGNMMVNFKGKAKNIVTINDQLKQGAEKWKYTYVDLYTSFLNMRGEMDPQYATDGLHLNAAGYTHWVSILLSLIK